MNPPTKAVQLAVERGEAYYDSEQADRIIRFAETYIVPQFIKGKFKLLQWQETWLKTLYGWRSSVDGSKLFKRAVLHVSKKNGKTLIVSIVCLFELLNQDTPSPLVVSASTTRENATQVFKELHHTIKRHPDTLDKLAKATPSNKKIRIEKRNGLYVALSSDAGNAEGLNVTGVAVIDEAHAHRSDKLYRSLEYSTCASGATLIVISTAGNDLTHWYYSLYTKAKRCLSGDDLDHTFFPAVFEIKSEDNESPASWIQCNPSLNVSFSESAFRADLNAAKSDTASWLSFQRYRLNRWVSGSDEAAFDVLKWDTCKEIIPEHTLVSAPMFMGIDLSQSVDPSSISAVWVLPDKKYHVKSWAFVAEEGVRRREQHNLPRYQQFKHDGNMTITPGDMIDTTVIKAKILDLADRYNVKGCVFDQYSAFVLANEVSQTGLEVWRSPQSFRYMSAPIKEMTQAINEKRISHDGNTWLRWCVQCSRLETNSFGDCRVHRDKSSDHVDAVISTVMAIGQAMAEASQTLYPVKSRYDNVGIDFL